MVVPFKFLVEIMLQLHRQMAHVGRNKLIKMVQEVVWHHSVSTVAADICASCVHCQSYKTPAALAKPPILKIHSEYPFHIIAADLLQLPKTSDGFVGCLVVVDHFSKWLVALPIRNKRAETISSLMEHRVLPCLPGKPGQILTDNGVEFTSQLFNAVLMKYDIHHMHTTPYHPQSNGAVERTNRTVIQMLRSLGENSASWSNNLAQAVLTYNHTWHSSIAMTPSQCLLSVGYDRANQPWVDRDISTQWREGHPRFAPFKLQELVMKRDQLVGHLTGNKLAQKYEGPFVVTKVHDNNVTYEITKGDITIRAHYSQLKPYVPLPPYLEDYQWTWTFPNDMSAGQQDVEKTSAVDQLYSRQEYDTFDSEESLDKPLLFEENLSVDSNCDFSGFSPRASVPGHTRPVLPDDTPRGFSSAGFPPRGIPSERVWVPSARSTSTPASPLCGIGGDAGQELVTEVLDVSPFWDSVVTSPGVIQCPIFTTVTTSMAQMGSSEFSTPPIATRCVVGESQLISIQMAPNLTLGTANTAVTIGSDCTHCGLEGEGEAADPQQLLSSAIEILQEHESSLATLEAELQASGAIDKTVSGSGITVPGVSAESLISLGEAPVEAAENATSIVSASAQDMFLRIENRRDSFEEFVQDSFLGFQNSPMPVSRMRLNKLREANRRCSFSPLKDQVAEARRILLAYREKSDQQRYERLAGYRSSLRSGTSLGLPGIMPALRIIGLIQNLQFLLLCGVNESILGHRVLFQRNVFKSTWGCWGFHPVHDFM